MHFRSSQVLVVGVLGLALLDSAPAADSPECAPRGEADAGDEEPATESAGCREVVYRVRVDALSDAASRSAAVRRLDAAGIEAVAQGAFLEVGVFTNEDDAEERMFALLGLGFTSVRISAGDRVVQTDAVDDNDDPDAFTFGGAETEEDEPSDASDPGRFVPRLEDARVTTGYLPRSRQPVETYHDGTLSGTLRWRPDGPWEGRLGARFDGQLQTARGGADGDVGTAWGTLDYTENWLRYRASWGRVTAGTQVVPWGRMDLLPPGDRLSARDLTRGPLNPIDDARRASPSIRLETYGTVDVDAVITPVFRPAELPRSGTLWHPVDQRRGRLLGVPDEPLVRALVRAGSFEHEPRGRDQDVVGGVRLTRSARTFDWGLTFQSARHSAPYYALSDAAREAVLANGVSAAVAAEGDTFSARHPRTLIAGADAAVDAGGATWRFEGIWSSDEPATRENDLRFVTRNGFNWAAGAEFFPGDANLRVSLQLTGEHLLGAGDVLDPTETYQFGGEIEQPWARERWHARLRFSFGLDRTDVYLNPELAWSATDNSEITLAGHYFRGADDTLGGYFEDNDMITLGWRLQM